MSSAAPVRGAAPAALRLPDRPRAGALIELTKPGITRLVLVTTAAGFYLGAAGRPALGLLLHTLIGVGLVAGGTNALNQCFEREIDARMHRTRHRPLPSGRLTPAEAFAFSAGISVGGLLYLAAFVDLLTAGLVALSLTSYVFLYTPLKRRTPWVTELGAVPGALPIMAGWTAAAGTVDPGAWALFGILFLWQLPHFFALAWLHRDDYRAGGLAMVSVSDPDGRATGRRAVAYAAVLLPVSLTPVALGLSGSFYAAAASLLGTAFLGLAIRMARLRTDSAARHLFLGSIAYLPLLLAVLVLANALA